MVPINTDRQKTPKVKPKIERGMHATQTAVTSYEKVVVDAITSDSESEGADEDVNHISNEEVSDSAAEQSSAGEDPDEEQ